MLNILVLRKRKKIWIASSFSLFCINGPRHHTQLHLKLLRLENYMFKYIHSHSIQEMALMKAIVGENDSGKKTNKLNNMPYSTWKLWLFWSIKSKQLGNVRPLSRLQERRDCALYANASDAFTENVISWKFLFAEKRLVAWMMLIRHHFSRKRRNGGRREEVPSWKRRILC